MKLKFFYLTTLIIISSLTISCESDDQNKECIEYDIGYVTSVNSPTTGTVNETIKIEVNFRVINGCGGFEKFIETQSGNSKTIEVEAKYEGCVCTQALEIRRVNYDFKTAKSGDYQLNFKSSPTEFITANITIN
ncbi:MAG: hypothetical protein ACI9L6_000157 [Flavobacterium sp.]|jgi:hypothetical protein